MQWELDISVVIISGSVGLHGEVTGPSLSKEILRTNIAEKRNSETENNARFPNGILQH